MDEENRERFERMLQEEEGFSPAELSRVQGEVIRLVEETPQPMKINNLCFDVQGAVVSEEEFAQIMVRSRKLQEL